jgi:hypothetical protein
MRCSYAAEQLCGGHRNMAKARAPASDLGDDILEAWTEGIVVCTGSRSRLPRTPSP